MNIYFAGSIRGGRDDQHLYAEMIDFLRTFGTVLTEHVGDASLTDKGEADTGVKADQHGSHDRDSEAGSGLQGDRFIYNRDADWILASDLVIAEVTTPSLGVGYEIGFAESLGKRVIALFRNSSGRRLSAMIAGNDRVEQIEYTSLEEVKEKLRHAISISG